MTVTPRPEQQIRTDFVRQTSTKLQNTWNFGNSMIIPERHIELLFNLPRFIAHQTRAGSDGFGALSFNSKYRFYARNEEKGNATGFLAGTYPTGKNGNGSCSLFAVTTENPSPIPADLAALQHKTIMVYNEHTKPNEMYSGAVLSDSLKRVNTPSCEDVKARCS